MEFSASLDTSAKVITIGVCVLFTGICIWNASAIKKAKGDRINVMVRVAIFLVLAFSVSMGFVFSTKSYETRGKNLIIKNRFNEINYRWSKMMEVREVSESEMVGLSRSFGVGGLFGYYGHYHNSTIGDMTFYATQQKNWVLMHIIDGEAIIVTPDDPKKFVDEIHSIITPNN
jgi:hypothetical protein